MKGVFLEINRICKTFRPNKDIEVMGLSNVDLAIEQGAFVVVSGPSGSGKTTLLNIIGCLDDPTSGEIILEGENLTGLSEKNLSCRRRDYMGFIFQSYNLIPVLNAAENIEYIMKLQGRSQKECDARTLEVSQKLGIANLLGNLPNQLSGGQQQRVAVARAVAAKPKLILADEPTANLDSNSAEILMDMMQLLNEEEGVTVIFSTHDPMVISKAKRSIILKDGKIISDD
jgi:putative ABC transport system ATP-binding protein